MADRALPTPEEKEVLSVLNQIDGEVEASRRDDRWDDRCARALRWRYADDKLWGSPNEEPIFNANVLGNLLERKIALLTQSRPDIRVSARNSSLSAASRVLTDTARAVFDEQSLDARLEDGANLAATFGFTCFNTAWDPYADYGEGNITITALDPRRVWLDPHVESAAEMHKSRYIRVDTPMSIADIRQVWPGRGALVTPDSRLSSFKELRTAGSWFGDRFKRSIRPSSPANAPFPWAVISEYWLQDDQLGDDGKSLYPTGRVLHRAADQDVILDDMANPYWDGAWPFDIWDWRQKIGTPTGISDVEELRKTQEAFLRLMNAMTKNVLLSSAVTVIGDHDALTPENWQSLMTNKAARILRVTRGRQIKIEPPPTMPETHFRLSETFNRLMEMLVGVPEALQGKKQQGVAATSAIEGLQTAAEMLVRSAARRLEYVLERMGQKIVSRIIQYYDADRTLSILSPSRDWQEYTFKRAELIANDVTAEERRRFFTNFRFKISPLSSLPMNRIQRALLAKEMFSLGVVDDEEVLTQAEYPNWREVLSRTRQKQQSGQLPMPEQKRTKSNRRGTQLGVGG